MVARRDRVCGAKSRSLCLGTVTRSFVLTPLTVGGLTDYKPASFHHYTIQQPTTPSSNQRHHPATNDTIQHHHHPQATNDTHVRSGPCTHTDTHGRHTRTNAVTALAATRKALAVPPVVRRLLQQPHRHRSAAANAAAMDQAAAPRRSQQQDAPPSDQRKQAQSIPPPPLVRAWLLPGLPHVTGPYVVGTTDIEWAEPQFSELVIEGQVRDDRAPMQNHTRGYAHTHARTHTFDVDRRDDGTAQQPALRTTGILARLFYPANQRRGVHPIPYRASSLPGYHHTRWWVRQKNRTRCSRVCARSLLTPPRRLRPSLVGRSAGSRTLATLLAMAIS